MRPVLAFLAFGILLSLSGCLFAGTPQSARGIAGTVLDENNLPVAGALVRVKATDLFTTTDSNGKFALADASLEPSVVLTAWAQGYYIGGGQEAFPLGASDVQLILKKHAEEDNPGYQWVSAFSSAGAAGNCENCHSKALEPGGSSASSLPFDEWTQDAHALSARNPRFLTMYLGRDIDGNQSPQTRYGSSIDYGSFPLRPDPSQPYFGPGFKLDFPNLSGNCAACHMPAAAINAPYATDPTQATGVGKEGVACDFCHKVWSVRLNPDTGLPYANMPGILSFEFRRPAEGHQFFAGPFDDVAPGDDTYAAVQAQSQFCAPCHFGGFWNTQIYNSFGEWLDSPYSDAARATAAGLSSPKTCQDCHMPTGRNDHFARRDKGAMIRDPRRIFSHKMPGAGDTELLQNAVTVTAGATAEGDRLTVQVEIVNDKTGHHVPTDSPLRQVILLVQALGPDGQALTQIEGPIIPEIGGVGNPEDGYYAGLPGQIFSRVLMELWTETTPSGAYWNPTRVVSDNRLAAFESNTSTYVFQTSGPAEVSVTLLFRRAFMELMDQKGWDVADIVMETIRLTVP